MTGDIIIAGRQKNDAAVFVARSSERGLDGGGVIGDTIAFGEVRLILRVDVAERKIDVRQADLGGRERGRCHRAGGELGAGDRTIREIERRNRARGKLKAVHRAVGNVCG